MVNEIIKKNIKILMITIFLISYIFLFIFLLLHQKMPLNTSMTFNSSIAKITINNDEKNNNVLLNAYFSLNNTKEIDNAINKNNSKNLKDEKKYNTLSPLLYLLILCIALPIILALFIFLIPSKKISDNMVALNLNNSKKSKQKPKLGLQTPKKSYFEIDDDNL